MALLPEVNGQKRVVLYGGIEKTRQVIQVHNVDEIMLMKITKHTSMFLQLEDMLSYNSTLQTTEAPADTVVVLDPDSMTWTPRKTSAVRLFLCILSIQILKLENMYQIFFLKQSSSFPAKRASAAMASSTTGVYLFGGLNTET